MNLKEEITKVIMIAGVWKGKRFKESLINPDERLQINQEKIDSGLLDYHNFIIPLQNFEIKEHEKFKEVTFEFPSNLLKKLKKKYYYIAISLTDDPRVEHAIDWSDLGCFRMVYKMSNVKIEKNKNKVRFVTQDYLFKDLTIPDRVRWL
jgi:hypothetical protein